MSINIALLAEKNNKVVPATFLKQLENNLLFKLGLTKSEKQNHMYGRRPDHHHDQYPAIISHYSAATQKREY